MSALSKFNDDGDSSRQQQAPGASYTSPSQEITAAPNFKSQRQQKKKERGVSPSVPETNQ